MIRKIRGKYVNSCSFFDNETQYQKYLVFFLMQSSFVPDIQVVKRFFESLSSSFQQNIRSKNEANVAEMNADCWFLTLDHLNIIDLLNLSQTSQQFSALTAYVFQGKFANHDIEIMRDHSTSDISIKTLFDKFIENLFEPYIPQNIDTRMWSLDENSFELYDFELILNLLKQFGYLIQKLKIKTNNLLPHRSEVINRSINEYCSNSLVQLDLGFLRENSLEQFTKPFNALEEFTGSVDTLKIGHKTQPLNQLFPNLRRLNLFLKSEIDYSFIECAFPHLEHLSVRSLYSSRLTAEKSFENLLRKNLQIRSIEASIFQPNLIKFIHEVVPNIERLSLADVDIGDSEINFDRVKFFEMTQPPVGSIALLTFKSLEELHMKYSTQSHGAWIEFLKMYRNLTRLHIIETDFDGSLHEHFEELTTDLHRLVEVSVVSVKTISVDEIYQFMENHDELIRFKLAPCTFSNAKIMRQRQQNHWNINSFQMNLMMGMLFQRKKMFA